MHAKGFTHKYLPLVGYYLRANCTTGDTRKYFQLINNCWFAREQCIPRVAQAQHMSYMQNFSTHDALHALACKLGRELYRISRCKVIICPCTRLITLLEAVNTVGWVSYTCMMVANCL